jgi:hypothetical protein
MLSDCAGKESQLDPLTFATDPPKQVEPSKNLGGGCVLFFRIHQIYSNGATTLFMTFSLTTLRKGLICDTE